MTSDATSPPAAAKFLQISDDAGRRPDEHGEQRARVDTPAVIVGTAGGAVRERFAVDETIAAEPVVGDDDARRRRDDKDPTPTTHDAAATTCRHVGTAYAAAATTSASANAAPLGPMPFSRSAEMGPTAFVDAFATRHATSTASEPERGSAPARPRRHQRRHARERRQRENHRARGARGGRHALHVIRHEGSNGHPHPRGPGGVHASGGTSGANAATPAETLGSERTVDSHTTDASPAFHDHAKYASVTTAAARPSARRRFPLQRFPGVKARREPTRAVRAPPARSSATARRPRTRTRARPTADTSPHRRRGW